MKPRRFASATTSSRVTSGRPWSAATSAICGAEATGSPGAARPPEGTGSAAAVDLRGDGPGLVGAVEALEARLESAAAVRCRGSARWCRTSPFSPPWKRNAKREIGMSGSFANSLPESRATRSRRSRECGVSRAPFSSTPSRGRRSPGPGRPGRPGPSARAGRTARSRSPEPTIDFAGHPAALTWNWSSLQLLVRSARFGAQCCSAAEPGRRPAPPRCPAAG